MSKKIMLVEINENTPYNDVVTHIHIDGKEEEPCEEVVEEKEVPDLEPTIKTKPKRATRKKAVKNSEVEEGEIIPPTEPVRMKRTITKIVESPIVEEPIDIEESIVEVPVVKPKAKRAPRKKAVVNDVVEEPIVIEEPIVKPKAKRAPRKKAVVNDVVEEPIPVKNNVVVEIPFIAPRKSRAAEKVELYEKLVLNALP